MTDIDDSEDDDMNTQALSLLAEALPAAAVPASARARFYAELTGTHRYAPLCQEIADTFEVPLAAVHAALERMDDESAWLSLPAPGPKVLPLHGRCVISRLAAGTRIPRHTHQARELTYVLDGLLVSDGIEHGRGACMDMAAGTEHALEVSPGEDCVVVFATQLPA